jgi:hypothetical protein
MPISRLASHSRTRLKAQPYLISKTLLRHALLLSMQLHRHPMRSRRCKAVRLGDYQPLTESAIRVPNELKAEMPAVC